MTLLRLKERGSVENDLRTEAQARREKRHSQHQKGRRHQDGLDRELTFDREVGRVWLKKSQKFKLKGPVGQLRKGLRELRKQDKLAESRSKTGCNVGCAGLALGMVLFIRLLTFDGDPPPTAWWMASLVTFLVCVVGWRVNSYYSDYDLDDAKQKTARQLLKALAIDLKPRKKCKLHMDFNEEKSLGLGKFKQKWLEFEGPLRDESHLALTITRKGRKASVTKSKGARTKLRFREVLSIELTPSPRHYPDLEQVRSSLEGSVFTRGDFQSVTLQGNTLKIKLMGGLNIFSEYRSKKTEDLTHLWSNTEINRALLWLYRGLKMVKRQSFKTREIAW